MNLAEYTRKEHYEKHRSWLESNGREVAKYEDMHVGQLVTPVYGAGGGFGGYGRVHWFNKSGAFIGNDRVFNEWGDIYLHHDGKVFTQVGHRHSKWLGPIMQFWLEFKCKIATRLMKAIY